MSRIVVTGLGVITSLGETTELNLDALQAAKPGLTALELFKTKYADQLRFGEIKIENQPLKDKLGVSGKGITRTSLLALHACREAVQSAGLSDAQLSSRDTALVCASTVGGMCLTDELYHDANTKANGSEYIASYDCASPSLFLQEYFQVGGVVNSINTACSSSANSIMFGANLIRNGFAQRALVGGTDSLAKFTINGFNSLNILAPGNCRPFDKNRNGLNLGEGSAFMILEKEEDAHGKKIHAVLSGYCNSNDAFHPSSLSETGDGPFLAMSGALRQAGLSAAQIGYVCAHGTGTENNDEVESHALMRVFETVPPFTSTKSKIGHTLGASAAVEAVFATLALGHGELYPSLNFSEPIESTGLTPVTGYRKASLQHVMSNSFGFGGNCASLIFSAA